MTEKGFEGTCWSESRGLCLDGALGSIYQNSSTGTLKACAFH